MKISEEKVKARRLCRGEAAFTLIEVAFASAVALLVMAGIFEGYNFAGYQSTYSSYNLAANATAMRKMEQVISASWVPAYADNTLLNQGGVTADFLYMPSGNGSLVPCTNYTTISQVSSNPPYAMIQVQCVWSLSTYNKLCTNTVSMLRAPNL